MTKHLPTGGSTIDRTIKCPQWQRLDPKLPRKASSYADNGTLKHNVMEKVYKDDVDPDTLIGVEKFNDAVLTRDMVVEDIIPMRQATDDLLDKYSVTEILCEPFVELIPDVAGGSIDLLGVSEDGKTAVVIDYKTGFHQVSPVKSPQLLFYALCASVDPSTELMLRKAERLVLAIVQPVEGQCTAKVWDTGIDVLDDFEDKVYAALDATEKDTDPSPGDHCKYCPAAPTCPAKTGEARKALMLQPTDLTTLATALPMVEQLEAWCKQVKTAAHEQLEAGARIQGYKLVNKRATRVWNDPDAAMKKVKWAKNLKLEEACDIKLKSPPQLEKLCKVKGIPFEPYGPLISAMSSGTTLAKADDKRPEALAIVSLKSMVNAVS